MTKIIKRPRKIVEICINVFSHNNNHPLYVQDIYNRMRQRHWKTRGKTPKQTISSTLRGDIRFTKVGPNTFQLNEEFFDARCNNSFI